MAFWGRTFIFDGVPSELHSMVITSTDGEEGSSIASGTVELRTEKIFRRIKPYFYGTEQSEVIEIPVSITTTDTEIMVEDSAIIQKWLFGKQNYIKMQIVQDDMSDYYFMCFLNDPQIKRAGNLIRGFDCTMVCDSQFAYGFEKTLSYTFTSPQLNNPIDVYNYSENNFYTYPKISFTVGHTTPGTFSIKNTSDANRTFSFTNLTVGEKIEVNNDLQIVTSDTIGNRLGDFNKNFFRMLRGTNKLVVTGDITALQINYTPLKRIT